MKRLREDKSPLETDTFQKAKVIFESNLHKAICNCDRNGNRRNSLLLIFRTGNIIQYRIQGYRGKMKVYLDTSVISALFDEKNPERRSLTKTFFQKIDNFEIYISEISTVMVS